MRWAHLAGAAIRMRLTIFRVTARFLIPRAAKRVRSLMMRTHPEPIDGIRPMLITESYEHLPDCRHWIAAWELVARIGAPRIGRAKSSGISFSNSLKGLLSRKAGSHGAEGSGAARRRSRWGRGVRDGVVQPRRHRLRDRPEWRQRRQAPQRFCPVRRSRAQGRRRRSAPSRPERARARAERRDQSVG